MTNKKKTLRFIRNVAISVAVLLFLFIVAGLIYTWYVGRTPVVNTVVDSLTSSSKTVQHVTPAENAQEGVSIQSLSTPVMPGDNSSVIIKTNPGSWCTIVVAYNKIPSKDSGLIGKTADEYGSATWAWTVESTAPLGTWPVTITCIRNKLSAVVIGDLVVTNQPQTTEEN